MMPLVQPKYDITIEKNGAMTLKKSITKALSINNGDYINFIEDDGELYLYKSIYGVKVRKTSNKPNACLRANSVVISKMLLKENERTAKYRIGDCVSVDGKKAVYIITSKNYAM